MRILVTNDDGINAEGIRSLVNALKPLGEIIVAAPAEQQTAKGHSMTFSPVKVETVDYEEDVKGYKIHGTPKDCVDIVLSTILPNQIDLVASGINHGPNLCNDCISSGTVAAAMAGYMRKIPSIAFSLDNGDEYDYDYWQIEVREITSWFIKQEDNLDYVLNVNFPNCRKPVTTVVADSGGYHDFPSPYNIEEREDGTYYTVPFGVYQSVMEAHDFDHDLYALSQGCIVLTPLDYDLAKKDRIEQLRSRWNSHSAN